MRSYGGRAERQVTPRLRSEFRAREPPHFLSLKKWVSRACPLTSHLSNPPRWSAVVYAQKTYLLRMKPGASNKRGKTNSNTSKTWTIKQQQTSSTAIRVFTTSPPARAWSADACFSPHMAIYASSPDAHADAAISYRSQP